MAILVVFNHGAWHGPTYTMEEVRDHLDTWRQSGQTQKSYCDAHGLRHRTFRGWHKRYALGAMRGASAVKAIPVHVTPSACMAPITVCYGTVRLELSEAVSSDWVAALLRGLAC